MLVDPQLAAALRAMPEVQAAQQRAVDEAIAERRLHLKAIEKLDAEATKAWSNTKSLKAEPVDPLSHSDGYDEPRAANALVPIETAMIDNVVVVFENAVREPVVAHILPDISDWIELWRF